MATPNRAPLKPLRYWRVLPARHILGGFAMAIGDRAARAS